MNNKDDTKVNELFRKPCSTESNKETPVETGVVKINMRIYLEKIA